MDYLTGYLMLSFFIFIVGGGAFAFWVESISDRVAKLEKNND